MCFSRKQSWKLRRNGNCLYLFAEEKRCKKSLLFQICCMEVLEKAMLFLKMDSVNLNSILKKEKTLKNTSYEVSATKFLLKK